MKRRILLAATKVVALKGIEKASVTEIAKKARVTRSLIQYYLPKQDQLMVNLIMFITQEGFRFFKEEDPRIVCRYRIPETLEKRIRLNFRLFSEFPHYFRCFMLFFYKASYDAECRALNTRIIRNAVNAMNESVHDPGMAERIYFGMNSAIQRCLLTENEEGLEAAQDRYLKDVEGWLKKTRK